MPHPDYRYTATVAVACAGPGSGTIRSGPLGTRRSRDGARLEFAEADARLWQRYLREQSEIEHHVLLLEPTRAELLDALSAASAAVEEYSSEPDWGGGQVDFAFAGHGSRSGGLVVRDGEIGGREVVDAILDAPRRTKTKRRLALVLDSCHSGATLAEVLLDDRSRTDFLLIDGFAAALHDEYAWEMDYLGHGALTFSMATGRNRDPADSRADEKRLARAVRDGDEPAIRKALYPFVPNPVTYLTEGEQSSIDLINGHWLAVKGCGSVDVLDVAPVPVLLDALSRARDADLDDDVPRERPPEPAH